jgi:3-isopropylmalate/(R)-2-methylmalate dehydratase small subunit
MQKLTRIESVAAVLPEANVDTDAIFPARFLLLTTRDGLGQHLFQDRRQNPDFPLNNPAVRDAQILVAGENFGCGSSRENAVWALADYGIRVVIAPSFGEIFHTNCFRNSVLPITPQAETLAMLQSAAASGAILAVDLAAQAVTLPDGTAIKFDIEPNRREALMNGWDETALILNRDSADIAAFEARQREKLPWLYEG